MNVLGRANYLQASRIKPGVRKVLYNNVSGRKGGFVWLTRRMVHAGTILTPGFNPGGEESTKNKGFSPEFSVMIRIPPPGSSTGYSKQ